MAKKEHGWCLCEVSYDGAYLQDASGAHRFQPFLNLGELKVESLKPYSGFALMGWHKLFIRTQSYGSRKEIKPILSSKKKRLNQL
ncbi:hypothetical protein J1N35_019538 [Gossypium stocksii]|uniref:Uncharacterized protein n=1 Tax=Gossypium stocksii TaxID=47602 RepID=A0A9D3VR46_9ROSI|nr:hypothetical protein J1N35_019538 [Gossypium stocksii]